MTPNKQLKTTTVWRGDWTIGQLSKMSKASAKRILIE